MEIGLRFVDKVSFGFGLSLCYEQQDVWGSRNTPASLLDTFLKCLDLFTFHWTCLSVPPSPRPCLENSHQTSTSKSLDGTKALLWDEPVISSL